jgi:biotin operon repressor
MTKNTIFLEDRRLFLEVMLNNGASLPEIAAKLDVSRQRVYQLLEQFGLEIPETRRKGYWKTQSPQLKWLRRLFRSKGHPLDGPLWNELASNLPETCPALGVRLNYSQNGAPRDDSPSIDRIDSSIGYEPGNVHILSLRANRIKSNGTSAELRAIADYLDLIYKPTIQ